MYLELPPGRTALGTLCADVWRLRDIEHQS
jgi:hypothetical protein